MNKLHILTTLFILGMAAAASAVWSSAPVEMWTETGPEMIESNKNIYYGGGVFDGNFYTGQLNYGPLEYAPVQSNQTAMVNDYEIGITGTTDGGCKSSLPVGDYIFWSSNSGGIWRLDSDWTNNVGKVDPGSLPEALATDGTYLFTNSDNNRNTIYKYAIDNQANSFSLTQDFAVTVVNASRFRGLSYYDGYVYAVDYGGTGIYQIDASTGNYIQLGNHISADAYQAVRYNNELWVVGLNDQLTIYPILNETLGTPVSYALNQGDLYGIGVVGNGTDVTGFWVTSATGEISYFVPEPMTLSLLAIGGLSLIRRKR